VDKLTLGQVVLQELQVLPVSIILHYFTQKLSLHCSILLIGSVVENGSVSRAEVPMITIVTTKKHINATKKYISTLS